MIANDVKYGIARRWMTPSRYVITYLSEVQAELKDLLQTAHDDDPAEVRRADGRGPSALPRGIRRPGSADGKTSSGASK